jgi:hypothetical protein
MQFAGNEARRRGFSEMRLYTHEKMTENVAMYASSGWTETGRESKRATAGCFSARNCDAEGPAYPPSQRVRVR